MIESRTLLFKYYLTSKILITKRRIFVVITLCTFLSLLLASFFLVPRIQFTENLESIRHKNADMIYFLEPRLAKTLQTEAQAYPKQYSDLEVITYLSNFYEFVLSSNSIEKIGYNVVIDIEVLNNTLTNVTKYLSLMVVSDNLFLDFQNDEYLINTKVSNESGILIFNQKWVSLFGWTSVSSLKFRFLFNSSLSLNSTVPINYIAKNTNFKGETDDLFGESSIVTDNYPFFDETGTSNLPPFLYGDQSVNNNKTIGIIPITYLDSLLQGVGINWIELYETITNGEGTQVDGIFGIYIYIWINRSFFQRDISNGLSELNRLKSQFSQEFTLFGLPVDEIGSTNTISGFEMNHMQILKLQMSVYNIFLLGCLTPLLSINLFLMYYFNQFTLRSDDFIRMKHIENPKSIVPIIFTLEWFLVSLYSFLSFFFLYSFFSFAFLSDSSNIELVLSSITLENTIFVLVIFHLFMLGSWYRPSLKRWHSIKATRKSPITMSGDLKEFYNDEKLISFGYQVLIKIILLGMILLIIAVFILSIFGMDIFTLNSSTETSRSIFVTILLSGLLFFVMLMILVNYVFSIFFYKLFCYILNLNPLRKFRGISLIVQHLRLNRAFLSVSFLLAIVISLVVFFAIVPIVNVQNGDLVFLRSFRANCAINIDYSPSSQETAISSITTLENQINHFFMNQMTTVFRAEGVVPSIFQDITIKIYFIDSKSFLNFYQMKMDGISSQVAVNNLGVNDTSILVSETLAESLVIQRDEKLVIRMNSSHNKEFTVDGIIKSINGYGLGGGYNKDLFLFMSIDYLSRFNAIEDLYSWTLVKDLSHSPDFLDKVQEILPYNAHLLSSRNYTPVNTFQMGLSSFKSFFDISAFFTLLNSMIIGIIIIFIMNKGYTIEGLIFRVFGATRSDFNRILFIDAFIIGLSSIFIGLLTGTIFAEISLQNSIVGFLYFGTNILQSQLFLMSILLILLISGIYFFALRKVIINHIMSLSIGENLKIDM